MTPEAHERGIQTLMASAAVDEAYASEAQAENPVAGG